MLRQLARAVLPGGRIGVGEATGDAEYPGDALDNSGEAEAGAHAACIGRASALGHFGELAGESVGNTHVVDQGRRKGFALRNILRLGASEGVGLVEDHNLLLLSGRQRQGMEELAE